MIASGVLWCMPSDVSVELRNWTYDCKLFLAFSARHELPDRLERSWLDLLLGRCWELSSVLIEIVRVDRGASFGSLAGRTIALMVSTWHEARLTCRSWSESSGVPSPTAEGPASTVRAVTAPAGSSSLSSAMTGPSGAREPWASVVSVGIAGPQVVRRVGGSTPSPCGSAHASGADLQPGRT
jgi:hypothetical protein